MTEITDADIERVARAICKSDELNPDDLNSAVGVRWKLYDDNARAVIAAYLEGASDQGRSQISAPPLELGPDCRLAGPAPLDADVTLPGEQFRALLAQMESNLARIRALENKPAPDIIPPQKVAEVIEDLAEALELSLARLSVCGLGDGKDRKADADSFGGTGVLGVARDIIRTLKSKPTPAPSSTELAAMRAVVEAAQAAREWARTFLEALAIGDPRALGSAREYALELISQQPKTEQE